MGMSNEDAATVAGIVLIILDILTVAGRFYSRWASKAGYGWDDWTILIALLTGILPGALTIWASNVSATGPAAASNFNPDYVFTPADIKYTKITFSTTVLYFFITSVTKLSLLLLLHRIFAVTRSFRFQIYGAMGAVVAFWIGSTVADLCNCVPLEWTWKNGNADPRYCINYNTFWLVTGIFESLVDLLILALPFGMVSRLQLDRSKKLGVAGIFLMGGFVLFSGVAKIVLSYLPNSREPDFSRGALWTTVHLYTGILCANLPTSRPLFNRVARLGTGPWSRLSTLGKRWYTLSGGHSFADKESASRSMPSEKRRDYKRSAGSESKRDDYELPLYGHDGQLTSDNAKLVIESVRPYDSRDQDQSFRV